MQHLVLMGDSIFDNAAYTAGGPSVIDHLRGNLPRDVKATLIAHDGDVVKNISEQLQRIPADATHFVLSVGGNNALGCIWMMSERVGTVQEALIMLAEVHCEFQLHYRAMLQTILDRKIPLVVCTIYDAVPDLTSDLHTALCLFNDVIMQEAHAAGVPVIDLRGICMDQGDYSVISPIEPSVQGGEKIAKAIVRQLLGEPC